MGDYDSSSILYCSGVFSHNNSICLPTVACLLISGAAFLSFYKQKQHQQQQQQQQQNSSSLSLFARGVMVPLNFS